jgi:diguanylate cyclase (GGDEF)-like protein/PAS domain S-box-containing protein
VIVQCPHCGADQCTRLPDAKAEARLDENEVLYRGLFELSRDALMTLAPPTWAFTSGNPAAVNMFRARDEEDFISQRPWDLSPEQQPDGRVSTEKAGEMIETAMREGSHSFEWRHRRLDGEEFFADVLLTRMEMGEKTIIQATVRDITERVESEKRLKLLSQVLNHSAEGIVICDPQERILVANKAFERLTGFSADEAVGKTPRMLQSGRQDRAFYADVWKSVLETGSWRGEMWNRRKSGEIYAEWLSISAVYDQQGTLIHYVGIFSDITAHKQDQERIVHLAHYDVLTDLPNRALLMDRLSQLVKAAKRSKSKVAAFFIDFDRFKEVNDSLGHDVGDQLLQALAKRLTNEVREEDSVARLGGDEFVMIFQGVDHVQDITVRANNLLSCLAEPVTLNGYELTVTASMGISLYPDDATNGQEMIRNADAAMYKAKGEGRNTYQFYTSDLNRRALEMLSMENALRRAIERQEFVLHYQPQVDISSGSVVGVEALIRWNHPDLGLIMPSKFISIAEERGLIVPIGNWVIQEAARQAAIWQNAGTVTPIAVNISAIQFHRKDFVEQLANSLGRHGITPHHLDLEVTESFIMRDVETTLKTLDSLHIMGFQLSIDDFGTGYSSLSYLRRFPIDKIKIDQSFVKDESWSIITAIISLARSLELRVIAEGVETTEQLGQLLKLGCDQAQGFIFAPALSPEEFEKWAREWKPKYSGLVGNQTELLRLLTSVHGDLPLSVTNGEFSVVSELNETTTVDGACESNLL